MHRALKSSRIFADIVYDEGVVNVAVDHSNIAGNVFNLNSVAVSDVLYFLGWLTFQELQYVQPSLDEAVNVLDAECKGRQCAETCLSGGCEFENPLNIDCARFDMFDAQ
jgi:hypothetical protein